MSRTHRGRTWRERAAWTRLYDLYISLALSRNSPFCPRASLLPSFSTGCLVRRFALPSLSFFPLYLMRSLALVHQFNLPSSGRTPANTQRRCQARFHPPAHKGEPKRIGQSNRTVPPVGMAGVHRRRTTGNVAFSFSLFRSVLSTFVENSRTTRAALRSLYGRERRRERERKREREGVSAGEGARGGRTTANPSLPLKLEVNF